MGEKCACFLLCFDKLKEQASVYSLMIQGKGYITGICAYACFIFITNHSLLILSRYF